jgi:GTP-binding protein EngB required for normal cell division
MVNINAQEWLNEKYPINGKCQRNSDQKNKNKTRAEITELDISKGSLGRRFYSTGDGDKNLIGSLKLEGFINLRTLICSGHELISLDVNGCSSLEELDCQNNKNLTDLRVNNCVNLEKINCSSSHVRELDLTTCSKLEEVSMKNCLKLNKDAIKSNLTYDKLSDKLIKGSSQIIPAGEKDIRNILVIGITGNGKSTLANVLTDTDQFIESSSSTSVTKSFQSSNVFEYQGKKYRIIDNIGFGDTAKIDEADILFKIGEGIHAAKEGINQVLFVFKGRFAPEQVAVFNMFKDFLSESKITQFTTLVRTNFPNFRKEEACEKDKNDLLGQGSEVKEIVQSCKDVIYVDNPDIPTEGEEEERRINLKIKKRKDSRKVVLDRLADNCSEIYKLKE